MIHRHSVQLPTKTRRKEAMKILFVHQNFPGQYLHIARFLIAQGKHQLVALRPVSQERPLPTINGIRMVGYHINRSTTAAIHPLAADFETKLIRAEACAEAAERLYRKGFRPDLICAHPGWGESLFLKNIFPSTPILSYQEFFYQAHGFDRGFDTEFTSADLNHWSQLARLKTKRISSLMSLESSDWNISPTHFQRSTFPTEWQERISVIHDGIDLERIASIRSPSCLDMPCGKRIHKGQQIVTFINRRLEPYRGCHTMIRAIPIIQRLLPEAIIIMVGSQDGVSYGSAHPGGGRWSDHFFAEIEGHYDKEKVILTGHVHYSQLISLLRLSSAHIYLTYPFVLSWSMLEAMACGCALIGSSTAPVQEIIRQEENGLLVDFFNPEELAKAVSRVIKDSLLREEIKQGALSTANEYSLRKCLPLQLSLMQMVAAKSLPSQAEGHNE